MKTPAVGAAFWTETEPFHGVDMFWDHAGTGTYLRWLHSAQLTAVWQRFIPEGNSGRALILATALRPLAAACRGTSARCRC